MKFIVEKEVFEVLPNVCFGIVYATGINNTKEIKEINDFLDKEITKTYNFFKEKQVKEDKNIIPYREAFNKLDINPNKFLCSIEALFTRISKNKGMPHINPIVDLGNTISLKYILPIGIHGIINNDDLMVRFSKNTDTFIPFGTNEFDNPTEREIVYVSGVSIRTRRWIWRQGEVGKITNNTSDVLFAIDGFIENKEKVINASDELSILLKEIFNCEIKIGYIDINNQEMDLN